MAQATAWPVEQIADVEGEDGEDSESGHDEHRARVPAPASSAQFSATSAMGAHRVRFGELEGSATATPVDGD
jgi:hypothetical protein